METFSYKDAGVDIDAGNDFIKMIASQTLSTARKGADASIGGFAGMFDPKVAGFKDPLFMAATDGVGSKIKIAADMGIYDTIGIDLVAMCVNDLIVSGVKPLIFLDYLACGKLDLKNGKDLIKGIVEGCKQAQCSLIGGETAEMPGIYNKKDFDLAGFAVGAIEREDFKKREQNKPQVGDSIIGLPSSGLHSNGFSLVRHFLKVKDINIKTPFPFDKSKRWGDFLLKPTEIYVEPVLSLLEKIKVRAISHITGGGLVDNIPRTLDEGLGAVINIDGYRDTFKIYNYFLENGIEKTELLRTFNCGIGMTLTVAKEDEEKCLEILEPQKAEVIGKLKEWNAGDNMPQVEINIHGGKSNVVQFSSLQKAETSSVNMQKTENSEQQLLFKS